MILEHHPFHFLIKAFANKEVVFTFSKYIYTPDTLFDEREIFELTAQELTIERINLEIASLQSNQELALHSNIRIKKGSRCLSYHIPMIDFLIEENLSRDVYFRMKNYIPNVLSSMSFFSSGRSFHGYSSQLLNNKEWHQFMGCLLLVNPINHQGIIDNRWIGHRLVGGFSSLRCISSDLIGHRS